MNISPKPGHSYQLIALGILCVDDPAIAQVSSISLGGYVQYDYIGPQVDAEWVDNHVECRLSDFVLMIDKEVEPPTESD